MIDRVVASVFLDPDDPPWPRRREVLAAVRDPARGTAVAVFNEFSFTLRSCHAELLALQTWLSAWLRDHVQVELELSPVRVLDSLLWFEWLWEQGKKGPWSELGWECPQGGEPEVTNNRDLDDLVEELLPTRKAGSTRPGDVLFTDIDAVKAMVAQMLAGASRVDLP